MRGADILRTLRQVLEEVLSLSPPPGEGLERELRRRIVEELLKGQLGWEKLRLFYGGEFDILCHDESGLAVAYIETKSPRKHPIPEEEREVALNRARAASTLEVFYLTNGRVWERYSLPDARLEATLDIKRASPEEIERFFEPLRAERFRVTRRLLAEEPSLVVGPEGGVRELAEVLRGSVEGLALAFEELLRAFLTGELRLDVAERCFSDWQLLSGRLPFSEIEREFEEALERIESSEDRGRALDEEARRLAELLAPSEGQRFPEEPVRRALGRATPDRTRAREAIYDLLKERGDVGLFCTQTAHVMVGRVLLFRVAEDKGLMPKALSGPNLRRLLEILAEQTSTVLPFAPLPRFLQLYSELRSFFVSLDPVIFKLAIYDWWVVSQNWREELPWPKEAIVRRFEGHLNRALFDLILRLSRFDLSRIQGDVWRDIYQHYLPPSDRLALGGFYTDDRLVRLILELSGYDGSGTLLDPACGSGTFLVEVAEIARKRAEREVRRKGAKRAMEVLERICHRIRGIDIHPFAVFLTRMNLLLNLLDLVARARALSITYSPPFRVFEADYLEREGAVQLSLERLKGRNSRAGETIRRIEEAERIKSEQVRFVVGNPPWGGVLMRGRPLEGRARHYKKSYRSATGKFDIFVLFMERGLEQLMEGGTLAFVTQNRYLTQDYGRGIRALLAEQGSVEAVVDLGEVGGRLYFPGQTNYPCVTVVRKAEVKGAKFVRVEARGRFEESARSERALRKAILRALSALDKKPYFEEAPFEGVVVRAWKVPQERLREWAERGKPWEPTAEAELALERLERAVRCVKLTDAFSVEQGATPGGAQRLFVFERKAKEEPEPEVLRRALRGRDIEPFEIKWAGLVAIYPYRSYRDKGKRLNLGEGIWASSNEEAVRRIEEKVPLLDAPRAALFLARRGYTELAGRVFEGKSLRQLGKEWFDWHRPRDPRKVAGAPKIVGRRQMPPDRACFAVDVEGYLALDSCVVLTPKRGSGNLMGEEGGSKGWEELVEYVCRALGRDPEEVEVMNFVVAVLNTPFCFNLLKAGRAAQRGGYITIGERELSRVLVPLREERWALELVRRLAEGKEKDASRLFEL